MNAPDRSAQPVDVLAVMDDAALTLAKVAQIQMTERADEMREARAAVAELVEAAKHVSAFSDDPCGRTFTLAEAVKQPEFVALFAALARVQGGVE